MDTNADGKISKEEFTAFLKQMFGAMNSGTKVPGTFVFYDINSRGDAIRALLHHAGEEYKDERFAVADFGPVKESGRFPTQSMPIWE